VVKPNAEQYWTRGPNDPVEFNLDDFVPTMERAYASRRVRALVPGDAWRLYERLRDAPQRAKWFERVSWTEVDLAPDPEAFEDEPWRHVDERTGRKVVQEDDGSLWRDTAYPEGAFTIGELVRLRDLLWSGAERAAQAAEAGTLAMPDRLAAVELVEAADELDMRIALLQLQPASAEEAQEIKRRVLEVLARSENPAPPKPRDNAKLKRRLMR